MSHNSEKGPKQARRGVVKITGVFFGAVLAASCGSANTANNPNNQSTTTELSNSGTGNTGAGNTAPETTTPTTQVQNPTTTTSESSGYNFPYFIPELGSLCNTLPSPCVMPLSPENTNLAQGDYINYQNGYDNTFAVYPKSATSSQTGDRVYPLCYEEGTQSVTNPITGQPSRLWYYIAMPLKYMIDTSFNQFINNPSFPEQTFPFNNENSLLVSAPMAWSGSNTPISGVPHCSSSTGG